MCFHLPAWRPGRYELGNFARNLQGWSAQNETGETLPWQKTCKDCWEVGARGARLVTIRYTYFAFELDAGSCYFDDSLLYINPVNCLVYPADRLDEPCSLSLTLAPGYKVASAMVFNMQGVALCNDYHELADAPLIASPRLDQRDFRVGNCRFVLAVEGGAEPDWPRWLRDFTAIASAQLDLFGEMPVPEYHFLCHFLPVKAYHGAEHARSCVVCYGPAEDPLDEAAYKAFLGICSHELFHAWNVKAIRPAEYLHYDYSREVYSRLGYVTEGVTTYYGELMLYRCGLYTWQEFADRLGAWITLHLQNEGRHVQTLSTSSFDTWIDGYQRHTPDRKVSMYLKGALVALVQDAFLRRVSANAYSLDAVMRRLYYEFAGEGRGYTEEDYAGLMPREARPLFYDFVWGLAPLEPALTEAFRHWGCALSREPSPDPRAAAYGIQLQVGTVVQVAAGSPAALADLGVGDVIESALEQPAVLTLSVRRRRGLVRFCLRPGGGRFFDTFRVVKTTRPDPRQRANFQAWTGRRF
jgi:predicted metalloprotease with PDZ domain